MTCSTPDRVRLQLPFAPPSTGDDTDERLAERAQAGCRASFEQLARRYQQRLLAFLRRRCAVETDAEDLVQETYLRAYRFLADYRSDMSFRGWLFTIAHRAALNHGRRWRVVFSLDTSDPPPDSAPPPDDRLLRREQRDGLWRIAQEVLTDRQFTVTWLHYVEEVSLIDIGRTMKLTPGAARAVLFRARKRLLARMSDVPRAVETGDLKSAVAVS